MHTDWVGRPPLRQIPVPWGRPSPHVDICDLLNYYDYMGDCVDYFLHSNRNSWTNREWKYPLSTAQPIITQWLVHTLPIVD